MRRLFVLVSLFCLGTAFGQESQLSADARFKKAIDLRMKIVPVTEAIAVISKETGVPLESTQVTRDLKCSIFVKQKSAGEVLASLANVLRCDWQPLGDGYQLYVPQNQLSSERIYLAAEEREARREIETTVNRFARGAQTPFDDLPKRRNELLDRLREIKVEGRERSALLEDIAALESVSRGGNYALGKLFGQFDKEAWQQFWKGQIFYASTASKTPGQSLSQDLLKVPQVISGMELKKIQVIAQYDPALCAFRNKVLVAMEGMDSAGSSFSVPNPYLAEYPPEPLMNLAFAKEITDWSNWQTTSSAELSIAVKGDSEGKPSQYWGQRYTDADRLEWLFDRTGLPIVSFGTRTANRRSKLNGPDKTLKSFLEDFVNTDAAFFRLDKGFLMHRRGGFWRLRLAEIPESELRPLESKGTVLFDDYARVASKLSAWQAAAIVHDRVCVKFSGEPLREAMTALRFWATLTPAQKQSALNDQPIPFSAMSPDQRIAFRNTFLTGVITNAGFMGTASGSLDRPFDLDTIRNWSFFVSTKGVVISGRMKPRPLDAPFDMPYEREQDAPGIVLSLGPDANNSLQFRTLYPDTKKK